jgi:hypothetical protein
MLSPTSEPCLAYYQEGVLYCCEGNMICLYLEGSTEVMGRGISKPLFLFSFFFQLQLNLRKSDVFTNEEMMAVVAVGLDKRLYYYEESGNLLGVLTPESNPQTLQEEKWSDAKTLTLNFSSPNK